MTAQAKTAFEIAPYVRSIGCDARTAARFMARSSTAARNDALRFAAEIIEQSQKSIGRSNQMDLEGGRRNGLSAALLDRLELTPARIDAMIEGLRQTADLADPIGEITDVRQRPSGIRVGRMRVPIGVIAIIYESRPNVTADAGALCIKSGNSVILRGGSEAYHSNMAIVACLSEGMQRAGLPQHGLQFIETTDRAAINELISLEEYIDVIIPRGGKGLIETISKYAKVPVIKHLDGNCHVYVDEDAVLEKAVQIAVNAKTHRFGVCNAMETLLVAKGIAAKFLSQVVPELRSKGVELRGCSVSRQINSQIGTATEDDWYEEYLAPVLAIRVVDDMDQAIEHIEQYGSAHTDCIVTENLTNSQRFVTEVDSSSVMVNASTRFSDGFEYGLGAEIGISTNKLHARGPVGLEGLTIQKFVVHGDGTIRK